MRKEEIIKAWKDPDYRDQLGDQVGQIPEHPAGWTILDDNQLKEILGGVEGIKMVGTELLGSLGCCTFGPKVCGFTVGVLTYGCCHDIS